MESSYFCAFKGARLFLSLQILMICFMPKGHTYGVEGKIASHTASISSLLPSPSCSSSTSKASDRKSTLEVIHKHGPCSHLVQGPSPLNHTKLLLQDESRVNWIQSQSSNGSDGLEDSAAARLPARSGITIGTGNYVVTIGLGTPKKNLTLAFDTGSPLTWTQCEPCVRSCYNQSEPRFNPSQSSSYANISCTSTSCSQLGHLECSGTTCLYFIRYGDQSTTTGFFATEKLTLTPTEVIDNFEFGCGEKNRGLFLGAAGLMGLSDDKISIVQQTAAKYGKHFSYCLPSSPSSTGHLTFGKDGGASSSVSFTPLSKIPPSSQFYRISIEGISVGGNRLSIPSTVFSSGGAIIDSGTVITRLPPTAYSALRDAFRTAMANYTKAPAFSLFDTCYDFSKESTVVVPFITFSFAGGVEVNLDLSGILYPVQSSQICLAFAANPADSNLGIYGNTQQKTFDVVYDVAGGKLGFGSNGCS
ncbi:aspartyl protease family protein At5g10770-like [Rhodamnia argentea]|uniref:Aspartyl protease family protein At5g10770-like n=1 Tax=Rhodamnia argentea TaxID=178133 RepID=A0A8B8PB44_9MYRT|nr:aspartyl protease family protein At5g10770-like [Rhodamnia argentea]